MGFLEESRKIAEDFLQTAVFLDDRVDYGDYSKDEVPYAEEIKEPAGYAAGPGKYAESHDEQHADVCDGGMSDDVKGCRDSDEGEAKEEAAGLDAQSIVGSFMEKGIICSVINCSKEDSDDKYTGIIKKADIAVLDWDLYKDGGEKISEIIKNITDTDNELHELRLIVIYTYQNLESVKNKISVLNSNFNSVGEVGDYTLHNKYTTISLFSKPGGSNGIPERTVDPSALADKCIEEFTSAFRGVVPNVALAAVSEIRKNTHRLLGVLNKDLDIGYLSHRALLPFPDDAEKHLEEIISDELGSILSANKVGGKSNYECIKDYEGIKDKKYRCVVKDCRKDEITGALSDCQAEINISDVIKKGPDEYLNSLCKELKGAAKEGFRKDFSKVWYTSDEKNQSSESYKNKKNFSENSEKQFAVLTSLQNDYNPGEPKILGLGVIIEKLNFGECEGEGDKFLCMQPECDSVRLNSTETNEFIFIKLKKCNGNGFNLLLREINGKIGKYSIDLGRKYRLLIPFNPSGGCDVVKSDRNEFKDDNNCGYRYVGILKKSQAQRIANNFGAKLSRVGVNESEYLRRNQG